MTIPLPPPHPSSITAASAAARSIRPAAGPVDPPREDHPVPSPDRVVAREIGESPGPTLITIGAIHGNEPAGVLAMERVRHRLSQRDFRFRGEWLGLTGNVAAFGRGVRYIDEDLNRVWFSTRMERLRIGLAVNGHAASAEVAEQRDLWTELEGAFQRARGPIHLVDLHTSSAPGTPFVCLGDTLRNRRFALAFPLPVILGLEEAIHGAVVDYVTDLGHVAVAIESGQHDDPTSVDYHESALWIALAAAGNVRAEDIHDLEAHRARLAACSKGLPPISEIRYRHGIEAEDRFVMRPGYRGFQPVRRGEVLAHDIRGPVRAPLDGLILLPLYQGEGRDGFFIIRPIRRLWLKLSALLRRMGADALAPFLPGVSRHPHDPLSLVVDADVARWYVDETFHLLGYRKERVEGNRRVVTRRRHDLTPPP